MAAAPGPLPDFDTTGQAFNSIQVQFQRFVNVPAMQDGQLLQILVQQNQQILQRLDGLTERVDSLSAKIDIMKIRASAEYVRSSCYNRPADKIKQAY
jgi:multidrug efflux pump subunit AcrA (membrane-fusion protein)